LQTSLNPSAGRPTVALIGALALAFAHQYLFFEHEPGVSFPLFFALLYAYMFHDRGIRNRQRSGISWFLFAVVILLALTYALFANPVFRGLNLLAVPALACLHLAYERGRGKAEWWRPRLVGDALRHLVPLSLSRAPTAFRLVRAISARRIGKRRKSTANKVLLGLAFAGAVLLVVVPLLASADGTFNRLLNGIPEWAGELSLGEWIGRTLWVAVLGVLLFGYFQGFVKPLRKRKLLVQGTDDFAKVASPSSKSKSGIDPIVLTTLLATVNAVYALFVAVQFAYLFGAADGVLPDGQTYAEYARSGFGELVAVTSINFALLMVALVFGGRPGKPVAAMLYVLILCSGVMLYSAYSRLTLYEEAYGYTYIRFLVHAFMIFLAVLLAIAALRVRVPAVPLAKCYVVLGLAAYVLVNYVGMDRIIADKNIERFERTGNIDRYYLSRLSPDAYPTLVRFGRENGDEELRQLLGNRMRAADRDKNWRAFDAATFAAERALRKWDEESKR